METLCEWSSKSWSRHVRERERERGSAELRSDCVSVIAWWHLPPGGGRGKVSACVGGRVAGLPREVDSEREEREDAGLEGRENAGRGAARGERGTKS